ncbi:MAG: hypothetical protein WDM80_13855 [Limisphaerales bacterium]
MIAPRFIVGFSGHRDRFDRDKITQALTKVWRDLQEKIVRHGGRLELYSSIASGADTLAVESARAAGLSVHLILPKPVIKLEDGRVDQKSGFAADYWIPESDGKPARFGESDWQRSFTQITDAESGPNGGTLRLTRGSQCQPECYYDAGLDMLECCDVLVAVWDGVINEKLGGTAQMVEQARGTGLPLIIIAADTGQISEERMEKFAASDDAGCAVIREVDEFSRACAEEATDTAETSDQTFNRLEKCSNQESKQFRNYLVRVIKFHGCATFVAAVACILPHGGGWKPLLAALALVEFCLVAWALWLTRQLNRKHVHERWLKTRFAAELLRAMRNSAGLLDPLYPLVARHDNTWRRFAVTLGLMRNSEQPRTVSWQAARTIYVEDRLRNPDMLLGQIEYFRRKQAEAAPHFRKTVWWGGVLTKIAVVFVFGAVVYKTWGWLDGSGHTTAAHEGQPAWTWYEAFYDVAFRLMPIVLPLAAGVFISLRAALDSGRRNYRYQELASFLSAMAAQIEVLQTDASVRRAVACTEEVLLDELIEWRLAEQQNGGH